MTANLTANKQNIVQDTLYTETYQVASGTIHIYKGSILAFDTSGYIVRGVGTSGFKFAGISEEELNQATGGSNGDNSILCIPKGSGKVVKMSIVDTITVANIGDKVYLHLYDDAVALAATSTNDIEVGTIRQFIDANTAMVQI